MKIFYSWQNDLPHNQNRYFIEECIKQAASYFKDTERVDVDRDTKGIWGSPDIIQTILSKIDESDLFIADISIINTDAGNSAKKAPNPNVMFELGYAACKLGWDRIICLFNSDFGEPGDLPFDINHQRITQYSLKGKKKADECSKIAGIIMGTIADMIQSGNLIRPKDNYAYHQVLGLNPSDKLLSANIYTYDINLAQIASECCSEIIELLERIRACNIVPIVEEKALLGPLKDTLDDFSFVTRAVRGDDVEIAESERREVAEAVYRLVGETITPDLFFFGHLRERQEILTFNTVLDGTPGEKEKYELYLKLKRKITECETVNRLSKICALHYVPLAIKNISRVTDKNIRVLVNVAKDSCSIIEPAVDLFSEELAGYEGYICNYGLIPRLFSVDASPDITFDVAEVDDYSDNNPYINRWDAMPTCEAEDCTQELREYISVPISEGVVEFSISSLRPQETKWLGKWILVRKDEEPVKFEFRITSENSDGSISGTLSEN